MDGVEMSAQQHRRCSRNAAAADERWRDAGWSRFAAACSWPFEPCLLRVTCHQLGGRAECFETLGYPEELATAAPEETERVRLPEALTKALVLEESVGREEMLKRGLAELLQRVRNASARVLLLEVDDVARRRLEGSIRRSGMAGARDARMLQWGAPIDNRVVVAGVAIIVPVKVAGGSVVVFVVAAVVAYGSCGVMIVAGGSMVGWR
jgi:hypothetical protein